MSKPSSGQSAATKQPTIIYRHGEQEKAHYRSRRFFLANSEWFFDTREQANVGPFGTEAAASKALNLYLRVINSENASLAMAVSQANNGHWSITHYQ